MEVPEVITKNATELATVMVAVEVPVVVVATVMVVVEVPSGPRTGPQQTPRADSFFQLPIGILNKGNALPH